MVADSYSDLFISCDWATFIHSFMQTLPILNNNNSCAIALKCQHCKRSWENSSCIWTKLMGFLEDGMNAWLELWIIAGFSFAFIYNKCHHQCKFWFIVICIRWRCGSFGVPRANEKWCHIYLLWIFLKSRLETICKVLDCRSMLSYVTIWHST